LNQALPAAEPSRDDSSSPGEVDHLASLVGGIAHEINNPITYVLTNLTELMALCEALREAVVGYRTRTEEALGERAPALIGELEAKIDAAGGLELLDELIPDAIEGAERIRNLVRDLLSLTRPSGRSMAPLNVHEILDSTLRLVHRELEHCGIVTRDYGATRAVLADHAKLGQVVLNLLTNAIHACRESGSQDNRICVRTRDADDKVEIEIEDSGIGIPEESRSRIFTPFFSTRGTGGGTGLGLFISREIIERHHGTLDFRSRPGGGTIFRIVLPRGDT
jgi:signal transduction histidine kinase